MRALRPSSRGTLTLAALSLIVVLGGCAGQQTRTVSSVYDYLYPKQQGVAQQPGIPVLRLPITVGVAFVPNTRSEQGFSFWTGARPQAGIDESRKLQLLEEVAKHFRQYEYVKSIEVIPSAYLTPGGSFANLDQLKTMYGIDIVALVSYDQVQFTETGTSSFAYWTIVGAYAVSGEKNETNTLVDTVVFDIASRKMLFRAPGTSQVKSSATPINLTQELRDNSAKGFELATVQMIEALDAQLQTFRAKVKERPEEFKVIPAGSGTGGGGAGDMAWLLALVALGARSRGRGACRRDCVTAR